MNYGTLKIAGRVASFNGKPVKLTNAEMEYLLVLARNSGKTLSDSDILQALYGNAKAPLYDGGNIPEPGIVKVNICKIRRKMQKVTGEASPINTVFGLGYNLPAATRDAA